MKNYFETATAEHQKKEKSKARELRKTSWWKQQLGKGICYHCEKSFLPSLMTMDHLIPIIRGGKSDKKNCVPCCKDCNSKKGLRTRAEMAMDKIENEIEDDSDAKEGN